MKHGGTRPGAGRKAGTEGEYKPSVVMRIPAGYVEKVRQLIGKPLSEAQELAAMTHHETLAACQDELKAAKARIKELEKLLQKATKKVYRT